MNGACGVFLVARGNQFGLQRYTQPAVGDAWFEHHSRQLGIATGLQLHKNLWIGSISDILQAALKQLAINRTDGTKGFGQHLAGAISDEALQLVGQSLERHRPHSGFSLLSSILPEPIASSGGCRCVRSSWVGRARV